MHIVHTQFIRDSLLENLADLYVLFTNDQLNIDVEYNARVEKILEQAITRLDKAEYDFKTRLYSK